ncbi:hypothetical protein LCGC14_2212760, partial [marine sediment metagenome]
GDGAWVNRIIFTDNTKATAFGGWAVNSSDGGPFYRGVCNACHEEAQMANDHYTITTSDDHNQGTVCTVCHVHNENSIVDGEAFKGGGCNGCHGYPPGDGSLNDGFFDVINQSKGAHVKHVDHLLSVELPALDPNADKFDHALGKFENTCGVCHATASHTTSDPDPSNRTIVINSVFTFGPTGVATYLGNSGESGASEPKTCSNTNCHFKASPEWEVYP